MKRTTEKNTRKVDGKFSAIKLWIVDLKRQKNEDREPERLKRNEEIKHEKSKQ